MNIRNPCLVERPSSGTGVGAVTKEQGEDSTCGIFQATRSNSELALYAVGLSMPPTVDSVLDRAGNSGHHLS